MLSRRQPHRTASGDEFSSGTGSWAQFGALGAANAWHWVLDLSPGWEHSFQDLHLTWNCAWVAADDWQNFVVESVENNNFRRMGLCIH